MTEEMVGETIEREMKNGLVQSFNVDSVNVPFGGTGW